MTARRTGDKPVNNISADVTPSLILSDVELSIPQGMVDPTLLVPHPKNAKRHDEGLIAEQLNTLGQIEPLIVNLGSLTGRPNEILSGHGRVAAWIADHPGEPIQVSILDVDDDRALRVMLAANPNPNDPGYDDRGLAEILGALAESAGGLIATGHDEGELEDLLRSMEITDAGLNPEDRKNAFSFNEPHLSGTRVVVIELPVAVFAWAQDCLSRIADDMGVVSNTDVFVRLLSERLGEEVPEVEDLHHGEVRGA